MVRFCKIVVCLILLCSVISCKDKEGVIIRGEISNLKNPSILVTWISADTLAIDTVDVDIKGKFNYRNRIDTLTTFTLYLNNYESAAVVFADKGQILKVKGDALLPDLIEVHGNEINNDLTLFKQENRELLTQRGQLLFNLSMESQSDTANNKSMTRHDEIAKLQLLDHELILQAEEFIKKNPGQFSSLVMINNFFMNSDNPQALERVLDYMDEDVTNTRFASRLKSYSEKIKRSAEGEQIPYFMLKDKDEKDIYSHNFNGKYLVLSFVSTAGIESRETIDLLKEAYQKVDKDSVEFLTVYIDSDIYPVEYMENDSIPWKVVPEKRGWGSDIVDSYNVQYVPFNILIDPAGHIKVRNIPAQGVVKAIGNSTED
ncbi:thioredoxin-like domain-containing protein [Proteiniphilum sp.]|uniref:thioredoxin-like domain-containing protein n=1 Tax=Proteiniphilum sp. TaxID=1926877 RepID=UPI002B214A2B|nr:thioredoxin-like domain-containing protein [Proteiniphilum sp.]